MAETRRQKRKHNNKWLTHCIKNRLDESVHPYFAKLSNELREGVSDGQTD